MGMDICGRKGIGRSLHYNWCGWRALIAYLRQWGVDVSEFSGFNDGERISAETCHKVANAISAHRRELTPEDKKWLWGHAAAWRRMANQGGCHQW